jgi:transposase
MRRLEEAGLRAHRVHPNKVRAFARASGYEAKTDAQDAQTLFRFAQVFALAATSQEPSDPQRAQLQDLLRRRRQLVNQRVQERNRLDKGLTPASRDSTQRHIAWLDEEIDRLDLEYQKALQSSRELSHRADLYRSVPGVGQLIAATLVADLPELGQGDAKRLTSLVGLAPWSRDSGRQRGYRAIRGGRGTVRRALYLAALSAVRSKGSALGRFYQQLRLRGKPGKVALVALMRKLLLQLHAVARRGTPWVADYTPAA